MFTLSTFSCARRTKNLTPRFRFMGMCAKERSPCVPDQGLWFSSSFVLEVGRAEPYPNSGRETDA